MGRPPLQILVDGLCPVCRRKGEFLRRLDGDRGLISLVDISEAGFDASRFGTTLEAAMGRIHAVTAEGRVVTGLEVFRRAYALLCPVLGWLWAPTGWPVLRPACDRLYAWFARNRYRFGGGQACEGDRCAGPSRRTSG